jgi:hypothetical protein
MGVLYFSSVYIYIHMYLIKSRAILNQKASPGNGQKQSSFLTVRKSYPLLDPSSYSPSWWRLAFLFVCPYGWWLCRFTFWQRWVVATAHLKSIPIAIQTVIFLYSKTGRKNATSYNIYSGETFPVHIRRPWPMSVHRRDNKPSTRNLLLGCLLKDPTNIQIAGFQARGSNPQGRCFTRARRVIEYTHGFDSLKRARKKWGLFIILILILIIILGADSAVRTKFWPKFARGNCPDMKPPKLVNFCPDKKVQNWHFWETAFRPINRGPV